MTISKLEFKVTEVAFALGTGSQEYDLVGDMLLEGYPRPIIDTILAKARKLHTSIEDEERIHRIGKMIQEELEKNG